MHFWMKLVSNFHWTTIIPNRGFQGITYLLGIKLPALSLFKMKPSGAAIAQAHSESATRTKVIFKIISIIFLDQIVYNWALQSGIIGLYTESNKARIIVMSVSFIIESVFDDMTFIRAPAEIFFGSMVGRLKKRKGNANQLQEIARS